jgi:hypothetical protein
MHGIPPAFVGYERRNVSGNWRLATHGSPDAAGVRYWTESGNEIVLRADVPAFYLVYCQIETLGVDAKLELKAPLAGVLIPRWDWKTYDFQQVTQLSSAASPATVEPTWTAINRRLAPYRHVAAVWLVETTAFDEFIRIQLITNAALAANPALVGVWRLPKCNEPAVEFANCICGVPFTTAATATLVGQLGDLFWARISEMYFWDVTNVTTPGSVRWGTVSYNPSVGDARAVSPNFAWEVKVTISSIPGETVSGTVRLFVRFGFGGSTLLIDTYIAFNSTPATYTFPIARQTEAPFNIELQEIQSAHRFRIGVSLSVTD